MVLESRPISCPGCSCTETKRSFSVNHYTLAPCANCGLWRLEPQPTPQALVEYYQHDYYTNRQWVSQVEFQTVLNMSRGKITSFQETLEKLKSIAPGNRLMDVGCAFGQYLHFAQQAGFKAEGVELDTALAARARDFGLRVIGGDFLSAELSLESYDCVTFWYVLEHVTDPLAYLTKSWHLLGDNGVLFIRVPNMLFGLPFLYLSKLAGIKKLPSIFSHIPAHLFFYTPASLSRLVKAAGFELIQVEHGLPVFEYKDNLKTRLMNFFRKTNYWMAESVRWITGNKIIPGAYISLYARKILDRGSKNL